jgi:rod shape-determining protein MreC
VSQGTVPKRILLGVLFILVLIISIHVTSLQRERVTLIERLIRDGLSIPQTLFSRIGGTISDYLNDVMDVREIRAENLILHQQVAELLAENNRLRSQAMENERLRKMLEFKEQTPYNLISAKVVARDPSNWTNTIILDVGEADGVKKDMAVVTHQGLVGHVISVTGRTCRVLLLLDSRSAVGARVERSRDLVIVEGIEGNEEFSWLKPLIRDVDVMEGDRIVSSGLGPIYPGEILIGEVKEVITDVHSMTKYAMVKPSVDFLRLEEVFVILESGPKE